MKSGPPFSNHFHRTKNQSADRMAAFTLVEMLVTMAIVGTLAAFFLGAIQSSWKKAEMAREIAAAKTLITAYVSRATDNDGVYLPGYDRTAENVRLPDGSTIGSEPIAWRYAFRLAPYFDNRVTGVLLVNKNAKKITIDNFYSISAYSAFGINNLFVGGDIQANGEYKHPNEILTRQSQAAPILVFATASDTPSDKGGMGGFCTLTPPRETSEMWNASSHGYVDARHNDKALCAFLDGSVKPLSLEELKDMRLWSRNAYAANDPQYTIPLSAPSGGRR